MTRSRSRRLALLVALALAQQGCGGDAPARPAADGRGAAGATEPTAVDGQTTTPDDDAGPSGPASSSSRSDAPKPSGRPSAPGPTTTAASGSGSPTTTGPGGPSGTTTTTPVGGCPDPRGCPSYKLLGGRWPRDADGVATIHYRVKTSGHTPVTAAPVTPEQLVAAVRAAARAWMDAVPSVRLVYDGTTDEAPNSSNNVVGWGTASGATGVAETRLTTSDAGSTYTGFSVYLTPTYGFTWRPCDPAHGQPCDDKEGTSADLQGIVTHEWGHVLGLDHAEDVETNNELTMYSGGAPNRRRYVTLGLGDVLGVRHLYPTNAPVPTLHRP